MKNPFKKDPSTIDHVIDAHLKSMEKYDPYTDEYRTLVEDLGKLSQAKDKIDPAPRKASKDALIGAGSSLLGILAVLNFERASVLASRAMSLVTKVRI